MCSQTDTSPSEGVGTCATNSARVHPTVLLRASSSRQCPSGTRQRPGPPATICTGTGATAGVGTLPHRWLDTLYWPTGSWAQARRSLPERHTSAGSLHTQPTVSTPTHSSAALWVDWLHTEGRELRLREDVAAAVAPRPLRRILLRHGRGPFPAPPALRLLPPRGRHPAVTPQLDDETTITMPVRK